MKRKTEKQDFEFKFQGYGHYLVTYTSPVTLKQWRAVLNDMPLINVVRYEDKPARKNLNALKRMVKSFSR